jgi:hypothetical protein
MLEGFEEYLKSSKDNGSIMSGMFSVLCELQAELFNPEKNNVLFPPKRVNKKIILEDIRELNLSQKNYAQQKTDEGILKKILLFLVREMRLVSLAKFELHFKSLLYEIKEACGKNEFLWFLIDGFFKANSFLSKDKKEHDAKKATAERIRAKPTEIIEGFFAPERNKENLPPKESKSEKSVTNAMLTRINSYSSKYSNPKKEDNKADSSVEKKTVPERQDEPQVLDEAKKQATKVLQKKETSQTSVTEESEDIFSQGWDDEERESSEEEYLKTSPSFSEIGEQTAPNLRRGDYKDSVPIIIPRAVVSGEEDDALSEELVLEMEKTCQLLDISAAQAQAEPVLNDSDKKTTVSKGAFVGNEEPWPAEWSRGATDEINQVLSELELEIADLKLESLELNVSDKEYNASQEDSSSMTNVKGTNESKSTMHTVSRYDNLCNLDTNDFSEEKGVKASSSRDRFLPGSPQSWVKKEGDGLSPALGSNSRSFSIVDINIFELQNKEAKHNKKDDFPEDGRQDETSRRSDSEETFVNISFNSNGSTEDASFTREILSSVKTLRLLLLQTMLEAVSIHQNEYMLILYFPTVNRLKL